MATPDRQALISRRLDFWLLGGGSLIALAALIIWQRLFPFAPPNAAVDWLTVGIYLRIGLEYPHLLASYKIAYNRGGGFIRKHYLVTVLAPMALVGLGTFAALGLETNWLSPMLKKWAESIFFIGVHSIFLGFGWHRLRQVWGLMAIYARYDGVILQARQRFVAHGFLMSLWVFGYLTYMETTRGLSYFGIQFDPLTFPRPILWIGAVLFALFGLLFVFEILLRPWIYQGRCPSANFLVPVLAILFWWAALSLEPIFFFFLSPAAHSLQYLTVVWAYERGPADSNRSVWGTAGFFGLLLVLGFALEHGPRIVLPNGSAAIGIAYLILSLHHYLLDGIIWRTSDPNLKNILC